MATDTKNKSVDTAQDPKKILGDLIKIQEMTLSPSQKGTKKALEEHYYNSAVEALGKGVSGDQIESQMGLNMASSALKDGDISNLSGDSIPGIKELEGLVNKQRQFLPAKGIMSPAQQTPEGNIQEGGLLSWIGGHSTGDLLKKMLYMSKIDDEAGKNKMQDPQLMAQLINEANKKAPEGYEAAQGYDGNIYYKTKPTAENSLTIETKEEQFKQKSLQKMGDDLDPSKNVRNPYGVAQLGLSRAERIEGLVSQYKDMNLDRRETEELAIGLNAMLQGSNVSAQQQVQSLVPQSVRGNVQKMSEWLFNEPQGLQQQKFVQRMFNDVKREKQVFQGQVLKFARAKIAKYSDIRKKYPEEWADIVKSFGIDPDKYDEWKKGGFKEEVPTDVVTGSSGQQSGGLAPEKMSRLEELRAKKKAGTLGR